MSKHPRNPYLTVDIIVEQEEKLLLIERKNPPHGWALPGGFVDYGERVETAAIREAKEETGLDVKLERLLYVYSSPDRDPRSHTASVVFIANASGTLKAADDAKNAKFFSLDALPEQICFDHAEIIADYKAYREQQILPKPKL